MEVKKIEFFYHKREKEMMVLSTGEEFSTKTKALEVGIGVRLVQGICTSNNYK